MAKDKDYWRAKRQSPGTDLWSGGGRRFQSWMKEGPGKSSLRGIAWALAGLMGMALAACVFIIPLLSVPSREACTAFETALLHRTRHDVLGATQQARWPIPGADHQRRSVSNGMVGRRIATIEHAWMPEFIACTVLFWQVRIGR